MARWIVKLRDLEPVEVDGVPDRKNGKLVFEAENSSFVKAMFDEKDVQAFYPAPEKKQA